jgi:carboxypeptidase C (cathepsin A)
MSIPRRALLAAAALAAAPPAFGQPATGQPAPPAPRPALPAARTTTHEVALPDRRLRITATAGAVTLADGTGRAYAEFATIAYRVAGADPASRPVTFALNGGPGSASAWLHLGALGPWRLRMDAAGLAPSAPPTLHPNAETWLDHTDLVFLDPIGTGYSRFIGASDEARKRVWSVGGDIDSIAQAIRLWLEQAGRMPSPKFLVGESYGGFRAPRLARTLAASHGVGLSGLVLVSPVLDFGGRSSAMDPLYWATLLPTLAAAARGATSRAEVADAEAYATGDYLADLLRGTTDPEAIARRSARVAALTGLDPALVRRREGRIDGSLYRQEAQPGRLASPYDLSVAMPDPMPAAAYPIPTDPMTDALKTPLTAAMLDLYARTLEWRVDAAYEVSNMATNRAWDFGHVRNPPEALSHLRTALALDPNVRVLVAHGLYDTVTPYFRTRLQLDTIDPRAGADRVRFEAWPGGHMFFSRDESRAALREAASRLYR